MFKKFKALIPASLVMVIATQATAETPRLTLQQSQSLAQIAREVGFRSSEAVAIQSATNPNYGAQTQIVLQGPNCADWTLQTINVFTNNSAWDSFHFQEPGTTGLSGGRTVMLSYLFGDSWIDRNITPAISALADSHERRNRSAWREKLTQTQRDRVQSIYRLYGEAQEAARQGNTNAARLRLQSIRTTCGLAPANSCPLPANL